MRISGQGVLLSLAASVLFVTLPGYVHLLEPLDSLQVVAHRVVWSIPMVFLLVVATRQWPTLRAAWRRLFAEPWLLACFPLTAAMMLLQWGIFIWAPLAGKTLELSLGYFLLPLAMVLVGRVFYGERLTPLQAIAVACALAGVLHEFWLTRAFSWVSLVTALGYPPYFMLRRRMGVDALSGFVFEMLFLLPLALAALYWRGDESQAFREAPRLWLLLPMLGLISALAFGAMMASSRLLPMGLFGILSYVEPVLLFLVAVLFLGEAFRPEQLWTYAPIWLAVLLTGWDSARLLRKQARRGQVVAFPVAAVEVGDADLLAAPRRLHEAGVADVDADVVDAAAADPEEHQVARLQLAAGDLVVVHVVDGAGGPRQVDVIDVLEHIVD